MEGRRSSQVNLFVCGRMRKKERKRERESRPRDGSDGKIKWNMGQARFVKI